MGINIAGKHLCPLDLICDSTTGKLSTSKVWQNIGNVIMSYVMLNQNDMPWELLTAYGAIVGGSFVAIYFIKLRYGGAKDVDINSPELGKD